MAAHNFRDIKGERFGKLTVKERDLSNPNSKTKWFCECDCGKVVSKYSYDLTKGIIKDCGCSRMIDLKNKKFGKLLVIERSEKKSKGREVIWDCQCDCGKTVAVSSRSLRNGLTKSCGCLHKLNLKGQKFGRLTVLEMDKVIKNKTMWKCLCDCGNEVSVFGSNLKRGNSLSCGCMANEMLSKRMTTHKKSYTRIYGIWIGMKQRCFNPNVKSYSNYGQKGIRVCDEWMGENGFQNFYDWSMLNGYNDELSIDRIDVNGNYEPSNCRWANNETQMNNMSTNVYLTYKGKTQTITQWSKETGIKAATLNYRHRNGWSDKECIEGKTK